MTGESSREEEVLASIFHGGLLAGHAFAAIYNARARRLFWTAFHVGAVVLELRAVTAHINDVLDGRTQP
jgi:hypothetical protein